MTVFDLEHPTDNAEECLTRIATACGLDKGLLVAQWEDVYSRAQVHYSRASSQNENRAAWCRALRLLKQHIATKKAHPTHVLEKALLHYFVFGGSSSGVEQNFSKTAWSIYSRRHFATGESEEFVAKVVLDSHLYDETELVHLARLAWRMCYGQPRRHVDARVDKGVKRKLNDDLIAGKCQSEASFIRRRRAAAAAAAATQSLDEEIAGVLPAWTRQHEAEKQFQKRKQHLRQVQAMAEKSLLPSEMSSQLQAEVDICRKNPQKNEEAREKKRARLQTFDSQTVADVVSQIGSGKVYLHAAASATAAASAESDLNVHGLRRTLIAKEASAILCDIPGGISDSRIKLISALNGCFECSYSFFSSGQGAVVKWKAAAFSQRAVLASVQCATQNAAFWSFLRANLPDNHAWVLHKTAVQNLKATQLQYKAGVAYIVVTEDEVQHAALSGAKNVLTVPCLLHKISKMDPAQSLTGLRKQQRG